MEIQAQFKTNIDEVEPLVTMPQPKSSGIPLSANFTLNGQVPLDDRTVVDTLVERDAMPPIKRFDGLVVYVKENQISYQLKGGIENSNWKKYGAADAADVTGLHSVATSGQYSDLEGTPTKLSEFNNDTNYITLNDLPNDTYVGDVAPSEDRFNNIWFDTSTPDTIVSQEDGVYVRSTGGIHYKICVSPEGNLFTQAVELEPTIPIEEILIKTGNVRYKISVTEEGRLFTTLV